MFDIDYELSLFLSENDGWYQQNGDVTIKNTDFNSSLQFPTHLCNRVDPNAKLLFFP